MFYLVQSGYAQVVLDHCLFILDLPRQLLFESDGLVNEGMNALVQDIARQPC